jgi:hypothetical protein
MSQREVIAAGKATSADTTRQVCLAPPVFCDRCRGDDRRPFGWVFRVYSALTIAAALLFGLLSAQVDRIEAGDSTPYMGLLERVGIGAWLLWMAVVAIMLLRHVPEPKLGGTQHAGRADRHNLMHASAS